NREPDAEAILRQKAENNPKNAGYWVELASHFNRSNKTREMAAILQKLQDNPRDFPNGKMIAGDFYALSKQFDEATKLFEEGIRNDPARRFEYLKRLSNIQQQQGKREEALRTVAEILKINPTDDSSLGIQASLLRQSGKRSDQERSAE